MRKNNRVILSLLTINALTLSYGKLKGEVSFFVSSNFGVDNLQEMTSLLSPTLNLLLSKKITDYELKSNGSSNGNSNGNMGPNGGGSSDNNNNHNHNQRQHYIPTRPQNMDLELATRYLTKSIRLKKTLKVRLEDDYTGLGIGLYLIGKNSDYTTLIENKEIDKLKLSLSSNNKYIQGEINYFAIGEQENKKGIEKVDDDNKQIENKTVDYNINVTPIVDFPMQASFNIQGQDKNVSISPTFSFTHKGFYISMSPTFELNRKDIDISEEIGTLAYAAPGYDKVEYFKKWEKMTENKSYKDDQIDLEHAKVTGHKGTWRLLGLPSGSLYGDSPIKSILNEVLERISQDPELKNTHSALKALEGGFTLSNIFSLTSFLNYNEIIKELQNGQAISRIVEEVTNNVLRRYSLGSKRSKYTSSLDIYKQIPYEFRSLIPGLTDKYNIYNINKDLFDNNYLYYNGLKRPEGGIIKPRAVNSSQYELKENWHNLVSDINKYTLSEIEKYYGFNYLIGQISNLGLSSFWEASNIYSKINKITELLQNPYEMKGIDIFRGVYFHSSEKYKNITKLEKELEPLQKEIADIQDKKQYNNLSIKLNAGHVGQNHKINFYSKLNDITTVTAQGMTFVKKENMIGLNVELAKNGFIGKTNIKSIYSNIFFNYDKNQDQTKKNTTINYNKNNILINTYLGYRIKAGEKISVDLGITHHGEFGHITPIQFIKDGNPFKMKVAKRDEKGNPYDLDGKVLDISKKTEKGLVDYAYNKYKEKNKTVNKSKRHFNSEDALEKEDKELTSYWYNIYNILMPTLGVSYIPHRNLEIYNQFQIPIAISKDKFSGINVKYKAELRYLIGDQDFDIFKTPDKLYTLGTHGSIKSGIELSKTPGFNLEYDMQADLSAIKLSLIGKNKDFLYKVSLNPIVIDFVLKPRIIFSKETDHFMKFGLELSTKTNGNVIAGLQKVISKDDKIFSDKLVPNLEKALNERNIENETKNFKEKIKEFKFDSPIEYTYTPFIEYELYTKDLKIRLGLISKYGEKTQDKVNKTEQSDYILKDEELKKLGNHNNGYITWANSNGNNGYKWLYFSKINKYKDVKELEIINKLSNKNYKLYFNVYYEKEYGFNVKSDVNFEYDNIKFKRTTKVLKHTEIKKTNVYALKFKSNDKYIDKKNQMTDENIVDFNENDTEEQKKEKIKKIIEKNNGRNNLSNSNYNSIIKAVDENKPLTNRELTNNSTKTETIGTRNIRFNVNICLGYTIKVTKKAFVGFALNHKFDLDNLTIDNIIIDDLKFFGSNHLKVKNEIAPEINAKYKLFNILNVNTSIKVPIQFENEKYKNTSINFKTGLELKW